MSNTNALIKIISKDFELDENLSENTLHEVMVNAFAYLVDNDFPKLLQILYKADVNQDNLKQLLANNINLTTAEVIANAYIMRQSEKIETWNRYSKSTI